MNKKSVRCYVALTDAYGIYNQKVYYTATGGWADLSLASCTNCGELFLVDRENALYRDTSLRHIASNKNCPICKLALEQTIEPYPETFRAQDGRLGHFNPPLSNLNDEESTVLELWELTTE